MDQFVEKSDAAAGHSTSAARARATRRRSMDYYDGNTVTALWNYAQHFAMSDNSYGTTFGPSTPGALNLVSGQTHGFAPDLNPFTTSSARQWHGGRHGRR